MIAPTVVMTCDIDPFRKLDDEGMTIVQVTHSGKNASYGKRVIQLRDGWIVNK
jgi:putative ABC transport system ATP-binding protein